MITIISICYCWYLRRYYRKQGATLHGVKACVQLRDGSYIHPALNVK
jgi:hypothetical protein